MIIINILKIAFLLGFLILIHELGHFTVAKLFKVKIKQFAIGFGPTIWKKQGNETSYELKLIPLGGFVNMLGEEEPVEDERAYNKKSRWQRALILLAGRNSKYNLWINSVFYNWNMYIWLEKWGYIYI